jgi:hypothetical protein
MLHLYTKVMHRMKCCRVVESKMNEFHPSVTSGKSCRGDPDHHHQCNPCHQPSHRLFKEVEDAIQDIRPAQSSGQC